MNVRESESVLVSQMETYDSYVFDKTPPPFNYVIYPCCSFESKLNLHLYSKSITLLLLHKSYSIKRLIDKRPGDCEQYLRTDYKRYTIWLNVVWVLNPSIVFAADTAFAINERLMAMPTERRFLSVLTRDLCLSPDISDYLIIMMDCVATFH